MVNFFSKFFSASGTDRTPIESEVQSLMAFAHTKRKGSTGTEIYAGYDTEEYLQALRGSERAKIFDEMRRGDGQVKMLLNVVKRPLMSATWEIEAADDSAEAQLDKLFIEYILFKKPSKPFNKFLSEALTCCDFGHAVIEKTYKLVQGDPTWGAYHDIASLDLVSAKTIERWNIDENGRLKSVSQIANGDMANYCDIEAPFIMLFNLDQEGSSYEGVSMLRPIYGNWFRKNVYLKLNAIGAEKYAVPTPRAKIPNGFEKQAGYAFLLQALEMYTSGQANYLVHPDTVDVQMDANNNYDPEKMDKAIDGEDRRMVKPFLATFLELGTGGNGGAYSLSNDLSDFFLSTLKYVGTEITMPVNTQLIPELIRMNRGKRAKYPTLKVTGIDDKAGKELAEILQILIGSKVVVPDDKLEESMRKRFGLGIKSMLGMRDVTPPPAPFGGGFQPGKQFSLSEEIRRRIRGEKNP